jgi:ribosomal protein S12 methylthiotransferase
MHRSTAKKSDRSAAISVGFVSLGCAKNLVDSQVMAGVLVKEGIALARSPEEADVVIVNTCSFIEDARKEAAETIVEVCGLKKSGQCRAVLVTGCLPQRYGHDLKKQFPDVDAFIGIDQLDRAGEIIRLVLDGETKKDIVEVSETPSRLFEPELPGIVFTGGPFAYLKIAEGCNHHCSFCAIPGIRGRYRSRKLSDIVKEAEQLLANGIRELDLISQDVTGYGRDLENDTSLVRLIHDLGRLGGKFWIRLLYGYPTGISDELLNSMASIPQVCHYLDIPIQHSHPEILQAMKRGGTLESVGNMARRVRAVMPDVALRTTCLVGFPGENEKHFEHLLEFVQQVEFDHLGVFAYSPEDGTPAASIPGRVDPDVAEERRDRLLTAQRDIVDRKAAALIGTETEVLLERAGTPRHDPWQGRSGRLAPEVDGMILASGLPRGAKVGDFVKVRYTRQAEYDMKANVIAT